MSARDELFDGLFDLADKYEIKLTNSPDMHPGVPEIGDFCGDVEAVVLAAGYTKPRTIAAAVEEWEFLNAHGIWVKANPNDPENSARDNAAYFKTNRVRSREVTRTEWEES